MVPSAPVTCVALSISRLFNCFVLKTSFLNLSQNTPWKLWFVRELCSRFINNSNAFIFNSFTPLPTQSLISLHEYDITVRKTHPSRDEYFMPLAGISVRGIFTHDLKLAFGGERKDRREIKGLSQVCQTTGEIIVGWKIIAVWKMNGIFLGTAGEFLEVKMKPN